MLILRTSDARVLEHGVPHLRIISLGFPFSLSASS